MCCGDNDGLTWHCGGAFNMSGSASQPAIADNRTDGGHSAGLLLSRWLALVFNTVFSIAITEYSPLSNTG